jgi:hypothetical protein
MSIFLQIYPFPSTSQSKIKYVEYKIFTVGTSMYHHVFQTSHHLEVTESAAEEKGAMVWEGEGEEWR